MLKLSEDSLDRAKLHLKAALKITGDNALLLATLANVYAEYAKCWIKPEEASDKAEAYARKALELDPEAAQAYKVLGLSKYYRGATKEAVPLLRKGYLLDPNDLDLIVYSGWSYILVGRTSEAMPFANRINELDPISPLCAFLGIVLFYQGKFKEAAAAIKQVLSPAMLEIPFARFYSALFLAFEGWTDEALDLLEPLDRLPVSDMYLQNARLLKHALKGQKENIPELMTEQFITAEKSGGIESCWAASFFAMLGDFNEAIDWLEHAVNVGSFINYPYMSQHDPYLIRMKGNPRYDKLMEHVKEEWKNFEA